MKSVYMGIDLGVVVCAWYAMDGKGRYVDCGEFMTSENLLIETIQGIRGELHVLIEECEISGWVYRALLPHVKEVKVCNPVLNAWIARASNKADRVDAPKLAEKMRMNSYSPVYNTDNEHMAAFKKAVQQEVKITRDLAKLKRIILAQYRREGVSYRNVSVFSEKGREALLEQVSNHHVLQLILQNYRRVEHLAQEKCVCQKMVRAFFGDIPIIRRLMKVPGVGQACASRFVAYVQTPMRFSSKRKLWRYSRLGIVNRSSDGKPIGRKRLDRYASGTLKDVSRKVFNAAKSCKEDNLFSRTYRQSLARTGNPVHARLNTQRKILSVLRAMWRDNTEYNDSVDKA